jgi:drug/metabolite transporter (DMT)-like permease
MKRPFDAVSFAFGVLFLLAGAAFLHDHGPSFLTNIGKLIPVALLIMGLGMLAGNRKRDD